ncbi:translocation protein TolB [Ekhidna sp.]|jgi:Tol biopolymer transport system component|uniref:translocation protein TolB n=1 Tax=Ekhidna sp. TaxID=2608089 RepID=UPI0032EF23EF
MFKGFLRYIIPCFFLVGVAFGQHYTTPFGQNRIQYKNFDWYYYSTNNFDIYYYPGGQEYALEAIDFLEDEFVNLTDKLGYAPYSKTKIFIYNSIHDLQQSNVGIDGAVYTIGGRTEFVKLQLEVAYPGKAIQFKDDLIYQLASTLINDMMYGGSLAEIFQNSYLLTLPDWFIDGAARYIAYGWSREMDDYLRDYMGRKKIKKLKRIDGESARIIGQSIWNYIAVKYGEGNISNILNLTRIIRKEENSIANTLGVSFKTFLNDWQNYYLLQRLEVEENYTTVGEDRLLEDIRNSKELITTSISFNKDANKVAYAMLKNGKYQVYVTDLQTGNSKKIATGGYRINGQDVDKHLPLLDWQDNSILGVVLFKRGFLYLNTFNVDTGDKGQKPLNRFRQVESFSFNDNGRLAVISGDIDGQNDIFLIAMNRNALRRITRDIYDDLDPVFVPGTAAIVFSSNRESDSVNVSDVPLETLDNNFNLYVYDLDTTTTNFFRLTNSYAEDRKPYAKNVNEIYYLSDQQGISNLYRYNLYDSITTQITNFDKSIHSYDIHFNPNRLTYSMLGEGEKRVYYDTITDLSTSKFTTETPRKRRENAIRVVTRVLRNAEKKEEQEEEVTPKDEFDTDDFQFEEEVPKDSTLVEDDPNWIDTDNYVFEDESETSFQPESFFSKYQSFEQENERVGPIPYNPRFQFNNVITSFLWDPYRNFMMFMETEINDVLENYKIKGGALLKTDFKQGDLFAELHYLKYWMDFKVRLDRKTYILENQDNTFRHKYKLNRFKLTAALPVTHTFRMEASPFYTETSFTNLNYLSVTNQSNELAENSRERYAGGSIALIFDNTVERSFNLYQGTRALLEYTTHFHTENSNLNFSNLRFDFRHYQKIHREITWANRILYGKQMGPARKDYMLGGMDNWLFADADIQGEQDPLAIVEGQDNSDILFNEFVTNLRGLDYNEAYGSDVLVFNSELRIPLFQYLTNGPIKSNFLRNFQIIGFGDIGSVWTGSPPFKDGRPITRKFEGNPFSAEIVKFQNPWLGGFGFGLRTVLFGYYIKFDAARPYLDGEVKDYRFYFTLGLDF